MLLFTSPQSGETNYAHLNHAIKTGLRELKETPGETSSGSHKFSPDYLFQEDGAVMCRVAPSFLRFGQIEVTQ
jgi:hypothetical protein